MVTLAGAEVIAPRSTPTSRGSLLINAEAFTTLPALHLRDERHGERHFRREQRWNETSDNNSQKTAEVGLSLAPSKAFTLTAQG